MKDMTGTEGTGENTGAEKGTEETGAEATKNGVRTEAGKARRERCDRYRSIAWITSGRPKFPSVLSSRSEQQNGRPTTSTCCGWHGDSSRWMRRMPSTSPSTCVKPGLQSSRSSPVTLPWDRFEDPHAAMELPSVDIFDGMSRGSVASNRETGGPPWIHQISLPGIATGEP